MKKHALLTLVVCLLAVLPIQAKQPLTHEAMWLMKRVSSPLPSPDGRWVVFSVTDPSYDDKEQTTDLWLSATDGSAQPRQITFTKAGESDLTWSPDSRRIAFSAKREGDDANQIYILDVAAGGEAQRVTSISTGARSPQFSPNGTSLLFTTNVYPGADDDEANRKIAKERKDRKYKVRVYESFPIRQWDRWLDDMQVHVAVQPVPASATEAKSIKARDLMAGTQLVAAPGFAGRQTEGSRQDLDAVWSPDGQSIVFTATTAKNTAAFAEVPTHLYRVAVGGGEPVAIATDAGGYSSPRFSPDGKTLYVHFEPNNGKVYNLTRLVAFDWPSMQNRRVLTANSDRSVSGYTVSNDSKTIYFTAEDSGLVKIYSVPAAGGPVSMHIDPKAGVYSDLAFARSAPVLVGRWGSSIHPAEVVRIDPMAKSHRNITSFNVANAAEIDWQAPRHFWFTTSRGRKIHSFIVLPPNFDESKKYPLLVLMHGGAANMWQDNITLRWNYHLLASPGYVLLLTNYTGSTGFGEELAQAISGDPLRGPAQDINEAADEAIRIFKFIDGSRQAAAGASYGGHLANWMQASTTRYKTLIGHAGEASLMSQWGTSDTIYHRELTNLGPPWGDSKVWADQSPIMYAHKFKTPQMLSVGELDYRVPVNETILMWSALQRMKVPSRLIVWPEENHWILNAENSRYFYKEVRDWLAKWL